LVVKRVKKISPSLLRWAVLASACLVMVVKAEGEEDFSEAPIMPELPECARKDFHGVAKFRLPHANPL